MSLSLAHRFITTRLC